MHRTHFNGIASPLILFSLVKTQAARKVISNPFSWEEKQISLPEFISITILMNLRFIKLTKECTEILQDRLIKRTSQNILTLKSRLSLRIRTKKKKKIQKRRNSTVAAKQKARNVKTRTKFVLPKSQISIQLQIFKISKINSTKSQLNVPKKIKCSAPKRANL